MKRLLLDFPTIKVWVVMGFEEVEKDLGVKLNRLHLASVYDKDPFKIYINETIEKEIRKIDRCEYLIECFLEACIIEPNFDNLSLGSSIIKQASLYEFSKKDYLIICKDLELYQKAKSSKLNVKRLSELKLEDLNLK